MVQFHAGDHTRRGFRQFPVALAQGHQEMSCGQRRWEGLDRVELDIEFFGIPGIATEFVQDAFHEHGTFRLFDALALANAQRVRPSRTLAKKEGVLGRRSVGKTQSVSRSAMAQATQRTG